MQKSVRQSSSKDHCEELHWLLPPDSIPGLAKHRAMSTQCPLPLVLCFDTDRGYVACEPQVLVVAGD